MASKPLQLNLVDHSNDRSNSTILIFQQSVVSGLGEYPVAWQVIENLGRGWSHSFTYDYDLTIGARDGYGNVSPQIPARSGQLFSVTKGSSGDQVQAAGSVPNQTEEIWIENDLVEGSVDAHVYRGGSLLASKPQITPGQTAAFLFHDIISIAVVSQWDVKPGQALDSAILSAKTTELSLDGRSGAATIVMSGGGWGPTATPFTFTLRD